MKATALILYGRSMMRSRNIPTSELYPISRLALHRKAPDLEVEVEAFSNDGAIDDYIIKTGFRDCARNVDVTVAYGYEEYLRNELLDRMTKIRKRTAVLLLPLR